MYEDNLVAQVHFLQAIVQLADGHLCFGPGCTITYNKQAVHPNVLARTSVCMAQEAADSFSSSKINEFN